MSRLYPYDENYPFHYGNLGTGNYTTDPHNMGEVWCATLLELDRQIGAPLAIQIVIDALKLTPANPTFLQARDAILAALEDKGDAEDWNRVELEARRLKAWRALRSSEWVTWPVADRHMTSSESSPTSQSPPYPATIYAITDGTFNIATSRTTRLGDLLWYRHDGRADAVAGWTTARSRVGNGWDFAHVFGGGGGVIYAITDQVVHRVGGTDGAELI